MEHGHYTKGRELKPPASPSPPPSLSVLSPSHSTPLSCSIPATYQTFCSCIKCTLCIKSSQYGPIWTHTHVKNSPIFPLHITLAYPHIHTPTYPHAHIPTRPHIHMPTYPHIHLPTHTHISTYPHIHTHIPTYSHIHISTCPHIHISTCQHAHIPTSTTAAFAMAGNTPVSFHLGSPPNMTTSVPLDAPLMTVAV